MLYDESPYGIDINNEKLVGKGYEYGHIERYIDRFLREGKIWSTIIVPSHVEHHDTRIEKMCSRLITDTKKND